jgi:aminopeptidase N
VKLLRPQLLGALAMVEDRDVRAEALRRYRGAAVDPTLVPAELRKDIVGLVAMDADEATWEQLRATARTTASPVLRDFLYATLGGVRSEGLAKKALELALTDEPGATTSASIIDEVAFLHPELAFEFALAHLDAVLATVDASSARRYVPRLGQGSVDPAMAGRIRAFTKAHLSDGPHRDADAAALASAIAAEIHTRRIPELDVWVKAHP